MALIHTSNQKYEKNGDLKHLRLKVQSTVHYFWVKKNIFQVAVFANYHQSKNKDKSTIKTKKETNKKWN